MDDELEEEDVGRVVECVGDLVDQVLAQPGHLVLGQLSGHGDGATRRIESASSSAITMSSEISELLDSA
jgi:hypothetical protein